jgi:hypothetical protein
VPHDVDEQLRMTAEVVGENLRHGDQVAQPCPIDHLAGFRHHGSCDGWGGFLVAAEPGTDQPGDDASH